MKEYMSIAQQWANDPWFAPEVQEEVQTWIEEEQESELEERFGSSLEFGTGGMRGVMGTGTNRVNLYTIRQATEGLARYIEKKANSSTGGVVIGYDCRIHSDEFAKACAEVLTAHQIRVYLFDRLAPTPLVSFEIIRKKAIAGIMITASHNPPEYNGYKVYWSHGGQVVPPEDQGIIHEVKNVDFSMIPRKTLANAEKDGLLVWLGQESNQAYYKVVERLSIGNQKHNANLSLIYTPLHGTGQRLVPELLKRRGFSAVKELPEQAIPDGNFSTVPSPNPEDANAFAMALSQASAQDELILANDPDADRVGAMIKHQGEWNWLTGNQLGILLLEHYLSTLQEANQLHKHGLIITTIVTSPMVSRIASKYGIKVIQTLTGFKWIWAKARAEEAHRRGVFLFGMEESHGYLAGYHAGDKDGVWAAMAFAELVAFLKAQEKSPIDRLHELYRVYGYHVDDLENQVYPGLSGMETMNQMMNKLRDHSPTSLGGLSVTKTIDYLWKTENNHKEQLSSDNALPSSNVLQFELEDRARVTVRPSGTEPKIKFYFNLFGTDQEETQSLLAPIKEDLFLFLAQ